MKEITKIAAKLGIKESELHVYGSYMAKISIQIMKRLQKQEGKLILITSINPTKSGEGKTTVAIGLCDALNKIGKKTIVTIRQPSLGPIFGIKGGATGGGKAIVLPQDEINFHFTGDIHAITTAHNLLSAMVDNHIYHGNELGIKEVLWPRAIDLTDRALRDVIVGLWGKRKTKRKDHFIITAASEIMSILCLSEDELELRKRIGKIIIGKDKKGYITAKDIKADGAMAKLLEKAINPNLVQTSEGNAAIIHGGPFGNFSTGTNSVISTKLALRLVGKNGFAITESGFATELGAEKFLNIVSRQGLKPSIAVIVVSIKALLEHGEDIEIGIAGNLEPHINNIRKIGLSSVVAINIFQSDLKEHVNYVKRYCKLNKIPCEEINVFSKGAKGAIKLAQTIENNICGNPKPLYNLSDTLKQKIDIVASKMYGVNKVLYSPKAERQLKELEDFKLPICMVKNQYDLAPDPFIIRNVEVMAGAGFIIVEIGQTIRMPGMPKHPKAQEIR